MRFVDDGVKVDNVAPPTLNELPNDILISPATFNLYVAVSVVPIPTFPLFAILILSVAPSLRNICDPVEVVTYSILPLNTPLSVPDITILVLVVPFVSLVPIIDQS